MVICLYIFSTYKDNKKSNKNSHVGGKNVSPALQQEPLQGRRRQWRKPTAMPNKAPVNYHE